MSEGQAGVAAEIRERFVSMEPYLAPDAFEALGRALYRSRRLRQRLLALDPETKYRRSVLLSFFGWCYRRFNDGQETPYAVFAPDFELHQTAALIDTAGSFKGPDALDRAREELMTAFTSLRFEPLRVGEIDPERLLMMVRFQAIGGGSGLELDRVVGHLFSFSTAEGYVKRLDVFWEESEALEAAGLAAAASSDRSG